MPIDEETVAGLRQVAARLQGGADRAVPHATLLALACQLTALPRPVALTLHCRGRVADGPPLIIVEPAAPVSGVPANVTGLSPREREVARLVAQGLANKEIAVRLGIRLSTVKDHVHHLLDKTGLPGRAAILIAWRDGGWSGERGRTQAPGWSARG